MMSVDTMLGANFIDCAAHVLREQQSIALFAMLQRLDAVDNVRTVTAKAIAG